MVKIDGLAEVVLNVREVSRALAFYQTLLGLERISAESQPGPIFLRAGHATSQLPAMVVLVPLPAGAPEFAVPRTLHHLALTVSAESFAAARSELEGAGLEVRDGKHPVLAARTIYVTDPDGNEVELIAPEG